MGSMKLLLVTLSLIAATAANVHKITVTKLLNNGDPIAEDFKLTFEVEDIWGEDQKSSVKITLDGRVPDGYKSIVNSTVYFANDEKNIGRVTFGSGKITMDSFRKPWNPTEDEPVVIQSGPIAGYAAEFSFDPIWLPRNVTKISASSWGLSLDNEYVTFNYYGIKNYDLSLPDTMIVENFQAEDFTMVTPEE